MAGSATAARTAGRRVVLPTLEAVHREYARRDLGRFSRYVDPGYVQGAHLTQLDNALERVERGELKRLIVQMPPRFGKSVKVSRHFPCWALGRNPRLQFGLSGYNHDITKQHSTGARDIFRSQQFANVFPQTGLASQAPNGIAAAERNLMHEWSARAGGRYYAVGIGGGFTGRGYDIGVIDDPFKDRKEADSFTVRETVWNWYRSVFYTRQSPGGAIVVVMARWHPDDLVGRLIREQVAGRGDKWEILHLRPFDEHGESVWPRRWSTAQLRAMQAAIGTREWSSLYEGDPQPSGGAIFKQSWFSSDRRWQPVAPVQNDRVGIYQSWDTAEDEGESHAYSSCATGEMSPDYRLRIAEVWRDKLNFTDLCHAIVRKAEVFRNTGQLCAVLIEKKSSGVQALNHLRTTGPEWLRPLLVDVTPHGSKEMRANAASPWCELGRVQLPAPGPHVPWLHTFESELFSFPGSAQKDQVDSFTQLIWFLHNYLAEGAGLTINQ